MVARFALICAILGAVVVLAAPSRGRLAVLGAEVGRASEGEWTALVPGGTGLLTIDDDARGAESRPESRLRRVAPGRRARIATVSRARGTSRERRVARAGVRAVQR